MLEITVQSRVSELLIEKAEHKMHRAKNKNSDPGDNMCGNAGKIDRPTCG